MIAEKSLHSGLCWACIEGGLDASGGKAGDVYDR